MLGSLDSNTKSVRVIRDVFETLEKVGLIIK